MLVRLCHAGLSRSCKMINNVLPHEFKRLSAAGAVCMERGVHRPLLRTFTTLRLSGRNQLHQSATHHRTSSVAQLSRRQWLLVTACASQQLAGSSTTARPLDKTSPETAAAAAAAAAAPKSGYKQPPKEILDIVDAPPQPGLTFSPKRDKILQLSRPPSLPPVFELSRPELKLAGIRIDPEQISRSRMGYNTGLSIVSADTLVPASPDDTHPITGYPDGSWINYVSWSPDGKYITFTTRSPGGPGDPPRGPLQLWIADSVTGKARPLLGKRRLNTVFSSYEWIDNDTIVATVIPENLGQVPVRPPIPQGPKVQDNSGGKKSQNRTWTDLLKDEHDGDVFEYYGTSELVTVNVAADPEGYEGRLLAPARMYTEVSSSPDGQFIISCWLTRPFSTAVPAGRFPVTVQLWTNSGQFVKEVAALPLAEDIPIAFNSCRTGPRAVSWRDDKPAELSWIEAQDGGDPDVAASPRDIVYTLDAHAAAAAASGGGGVDGNGAGLAPSVLASTDLRCGGVSWCDGDLALLYESWWKTRRSVVWTLAPDRKHEEKEVLFDRSYEDVYSDPGSPLSRRTSNSTYILAKVDGKRQLLMVGNGASPEGNKPFLDLLDLDTKESKRLWQSSPPHLESIGSIMSDDNHDAPITLDGLKMLLSRESAAEPPQTYLVEFSGSDAAQKTERQITNFPHPYPHLKDMQKEVLRYQRADGVDLTGTLYLPPAYDAKRDGPLPTILWAYPREYKSKEAAGQMRRSPHQFSGIGSLSPTLWLARGYAVLDGPGFPIIAEGDEEPNDTYVEQLTASAEAAVKELVAKGVTDPARVSVGGHSYGAFMAANLVAHCPQLFAAAIARSGAYNRTLTPFGFQSEERTLWQAPETYSKMSPFMMADRIKKPLLLIHGEEDNNTGTFPLQSERFYNALKGHGAPARLVLLPHEGHGYRARESVLHTLYEQDQWLEAYAGYGRIDPEYVLASGDAESSSNSMSE